MVGFASGVMIASSKIKFRVAKSWLNWKKKKNTRNNEILICKPRKSVIKYRYRYEIDVIIKIAIAFYCLDVSNMNLESLTNVNRCEASAPSVLYTYKYMHLRLFRIEESSSWFALHQSCRIAQHRRAKPPRRRSSCQESSYGMNLLCFQVFFFPSITIFRDRDSDWNRITRERPFSSIRPSLEFSEIITSYLPVPERVRILRDTMMKST